MSYLKLKRYITCLLVGSHLVIIVWLVVLYLFGGFAFDDFTTTIGLILPLFVGFTTMIVRDSIAEAAPNASPVDDRAIPWGYSAMLIAISTVFSAYLFIIVTLKGCNVGFETFDQFKVLLALSDTAFGVYIGMLIPTLFPLGGHTPDNKRHNHEAP